VKIINHNSNRGPLTEIPDAEALQSHLPSIHRPLLTPYSQQAMRRREKRREQAQHSVREQSAFSEQNSA
jgi:hypothetical protein